MDYRPLGRTGVSVSQLCLGAMMFGAFRQPRPRRLDPDHPSRARRRHQLHRHGRLLLGRGVGGDRRQGCGRRPPPTTSCSPRRSVCRSAPTRTTARPAGAGSPRRSSTACAGSTPTGSTSTRSTALIRHDIDETLGVLLDLVHAGKIRAFGASTVPASRSRKRRAAERRGRERFRTEQPQYSILNRTVESDVLPTAAPVRHGGADLQPARGRLAHRQLPQGQDAGGPGSAIRRQRFAAMYDVTSPANAANSMPLTPSPRRRRDRHDAHPAGDRVRRAPPGRHIRDRRPAHDRAPGVLPRRGRGRALRRRRRPHRRDRAARPGR